MVGVSLGAATLAADTLRGKANIVDGDTIEIAGIPVRLEGIDAPEQRQSCTSGSGNVACGKLATKALARMIGGAPVTCVVHGKDRYDRLLGECSADGKSLTKAMVQHGWALAFVKYSDRYVSLEEEARAAHAGIWQWQFEKPWDWRAGVLQEAAGAADHPKGCVQRQYQPQRGAHLSHAVPAALRPHAD